MADLTISAPLGSVEVRFTSPYDHSHDLFWLYFSVLLPVLNLSCLEFMGPKYTDKAAWVVIAQVFKWSGAT